MNTIGVNPGVTRRSLRSAKSDDESESTVIKPVVKTYTLGSNAISKDESPDYRKLQGSLDKMRQEEMLEESAGGTQYYEWSKTPIRAGGRNVLEERTPAKEKQPSNVSKVVLIGLLIIVLVCGAYFLIGSSAVPEISFEDVLPRLKLMQQNFPSQSSSTWNSLRAGARAFIDDEAKPLIVFLVGPSSETMKCLGRQYIEAFDKGVNPVDASELSGSDYGDTIELLKSGLSYNHAILLHDLEKIDARQVTALHVICDRESPVKKDAVVVMTAGQSLDVISQRWTEQVEDDKLPALLTRLKDRIVTVAHENELPCDM